MVPDGRTEWTDGRRQNYIPPTSLGDNKTLMYEIILFYARLYSNGNFRLDQASTEQTKLSNDFSKAI